MTTLYSLLLYSNSESHAPLSLPCVWVIIIIIIIKIGNCPHGFRKKNAQRIEKGLVLVVLVELAGPIWFLKPWLSHIV